MQVEFDFNGTLVKQQVTIPSGTNKDLATNAINLAVQSKCKGTMYIGLEGEVEIPWEN